MSQPAACSPSTQTACQHCRPVSSLVLHLLPPPAACGLPAAAAASAACVLPAAASPAGDGSRDSHSMRPGRLLCFPTPPAPCCCCAWQLRNLQGWGGGQAGHASYFSNRLQCRKAAALPCMPALALLQSEQAGVACMPAQHCQLGNASSASPGQQRQLSLTHLCRKPKASSGTSPSGRSARRWLHHRPRQPLGPSCSAISAASRPDLQYLQQPDLQLL